MAGIVQNGRGRRPVPPSSKLDLSRRSFLSASGLGVASLLTPGSWSPAAAGGDPWSRADAIVSRLEEPRFPNRDFLITRFGAAGNGKTDCTAAIRQAIDACNKAGGGRVVVPAGRFLTGAIHLRSGVNLYVAKGATLLFSTDPKDYLPVVLTRFEGNDCYNYSPLVYAYRQRNIAVTGQGTLDGQASDRHWWYLSGKPAHGWHEGLPKEGPDSRKLRAQGDAGVPVARRVYGPGHYLRPSFVEPYGCTSVLIEGVTIKNAPMWVIHPLLSRSVTVRNVTVSSLGSNNDGCDPECCDGVLIDGCHFDTGDDCIAIKAGRGRDGIARGVPSKNIVIRGCRMGHGIGGITIGSEESGGVHDVYAEDITMTDRRASHMVYLKSNSQRGGTVERIFVRNVRSAGVQAAAVHMTYYYAKVGPGAGPYRPVFRDIDLSGLTCRGSSNAISLHGYPGAPIGAVRVSDCSFTGVTGQGVITSDVVGLRLTRVTVNGKPA
jgi:polygalacturonase